MKKNYTEKQLIRKDSTKKENLPLLEPKQSTINFLLNFSSSFLMEDLHLETKTALFLN
jgi:hypothetical protein